MSLKERIESFSELGRLLRESLAGIETGYTNELEKLINGQQLKNPWFTPENVKMAIQAIANELTYENLVNWTDQYPHLKTQYNSVTVGVVMAGNIPLAGFHDFLSVLITGNNIISKTSSKDSELIVFIGKMLRDINKHLDEKINFPEEILKGFDMVIATGGNNSSRYFEYYFGKYPNIIRKNRNSIAILTGNETREEITGLGIDIFSYFGLGCRNVSKIYIPVGYDLNRLASVWAGWLPIANHNKYANNYDYNKAIFMVNRENFIDTGFVLLKENEGLSSPVAVLYYEFYNSLDDCLEKTGSVKERIQCIISRNHVPFGQSQYPRLWDYADGTDTIEFLLKKNDSGIL